MLYGIEPHFRGDAEPGGGSAGAGSLFDPVLRRKSFIIGEMQVGRAVSPG